DAFPGVILDQPGTKASGFAAYGRVLLWVKTGLSPEYLDSDNRFLEFAVAALQMTLHHNPQKPRHALITCKPPAGEYALQLGPHAFCCVFARSHRIQAYLLFSEPCKCITPLYNPSRLVS